MSTSLTISIILHSIYIFFRSAGSLELPMSVTSGIVVKRKSLDIHSTIFCNIEKYSRIIRNILEYFCTNSKTCIAHRTSQGVHAGCRNTWSFCQYLFPFHPFCLPRSQNQHSHSSCRLPVCNCIGSDDHR